MPDKSELDWFLGGVVGGVVGGGVVGWALGRKPRDDDRPVIVVSGGSLTIEHKKKWKKHGTNDKDWRTAQANGRDINGFAVEITDPMTPYGYSGTTVSVVFDASGVSTTFHFSVHEDNNKLVPLLEATDNLALQLPDEEVLLFNSSGQIKKLQVNGRDVSVVPKKLQLWMY